MQGKACPHPAATSRAIFTGLEGTPLPPPNDCLQAPLPSAKPGGGRHDPPFSHCSSTMGRTGHCQHCTSSTPPVPALLCTETAGTSARRRVWGSPRWEQWLPPHTLLCTVAPSGRRAALELQQLQDCKPLDLFVKASPVQACGASKWAQGLGTSYRACYWFESGAITDNNNN